MTNLEILADIIEPVLSGQYGRDVAEEVAQECLTVLAMMNPQKWQMGRSKDGNSIWYRDWFVFAETEEQALRFAENRDESGIRLGCKIHIRPWSERKEEPT
jgi:hypothetical protein